MRDWVFRLLGYIPFFALLPDSFVFGPLTYFLVDTVLFFPVYKAILS